MNYYSLTREKNDRHGVAYAPKDITFKLLYKKGHIGDWEPLNFELRDGEYSDYQANNLGWHLCSGTLKKCIESFTTGTEGLQWLPVEVHSHRGEARTFFVLHMWPTCDVLLKSRSIFSGDHLVKPVFNAAAIRNLNLFAVSGTSNVYVSGLVRTTVRSANITGIDFLKVPVVSTEDG